MSQYQYNKKELAIHTLHTWHNGVWKQTGWRCGYCDKSFKNQRFVTNHLEICKQINTIKKEKEMPIQVITVKGERYFRWGDQGKLYKDRKDAEKQAQAIYASGFKEKNNSNMEKK